MSYSCHTHGCLIFVFLYWLISIISASGINQFGIQEEGLKTVVFTLCFQHTTSPFQQRNYKIADYLNIRQHLNKMGRLEGKENSFGHIPISYN
jgi:hypothetical protein